MTARLENFLVGWLLFLGLKEGLVECATVCVKSWVTLNVALPKWPIDQFISVQHCRQQVLRAYCPDIYTVPSSAKTAKKVPKDDFNQLQTFFTQGLFLIDITATK